jgi:LysR family transcriptional regulator, hydrogen peroxide-inducible genes activator
MVAAAKRASDPMAGTIRLGVIPTIAPYLLPGIAPRLRAALPRLRIAWLEDKTDSLLKKLAEGQIDGAIVALEANVGDVVKEIVATDPFFVVTLPDHPFARKKAPVSEADLRGQELLLLDDGHCFRDQALEACSHARIREGEFRATSMTTLIQMVSSGAGITLIPGLAVKAEAKLARLHVRPFRARSAHRTIAVVWRKGASSEPALRAVTAVLRREYPRASTTATLE